MQRLIIPVIFILIFFKSLYAENITSFNIKNGYNSNVNETNEQKGSFYNEIDLNNLFKFNKIPISLFTDLNFQKFYKDFEYILDLTQEISFNIGKNLEIYSGASYFKNENDPQESYKGVYIGENFKFRSFELQYSFLYKNYLKQYSYGSYKELIKKNIKKTLYDSNGYQKKYKKGITSSSFNEKKKVGFFMNSSYISKVHKLNLKLNLSRSDFSVYYLKNNSKISLEDYEIFGLENNFYRSFGLFSLSIETEIGKKRYLYTYRKDIFFSINCDLEYIINDLFYLSGGLLLKNNNSTYNEEKFFKTDLYFSIGIVF